MNNVDPQELTKFDAFAANWWDPAGEMKALHQINPLRLSFILEKTPLAGKKVIDVGCGGGILTESLARHGADVTGIDLNARLLKVAELHKLESGVNVHYQLIAVETLAAQQPHTYDIVTCMEMLEHVPDPAAIIQACAQLAKPGGHIFFSTLNRNPKSYLFAILGAEYILKLLPKNTHDYSKFIRPAELSAWCRQAQIQPIQFRGIGYQPLNKEFRLTSDISVNYLCYGIAHA